MASVVFGNHAAVVVPRRERERIRDFYRDVLGCEPTRELDAKDDFRLGDFHFTFVYGDLADESEFLRSGRAVYLELKSDDVDEVRRRVVASGVRVLDVPDPHLYFQAPGGQVFRLVGVDEDLSAHERDAGASRQEVRRQAELAAEVGRRAGRPT